MFMFLPLTSSMLALSLTAIALNCIGASLKLLVLLTSGVKALPKYYAMYCFRLLLQWCQRLATAQFPTHWSRNPRRCTVPEFDRQSISDFESRPWRQLLSNYWKSRCHFHFCRAIYTWLDKRLRAESTYHTPTAAASHDCRFYSRGKFIWHSAHWNVLQIAVAYKQYS